MVGLIWEGEGSRKAMPEFLILEWGGKHPGFGESGVGKALLFSAGHTLTNCLLVCLSLTHTVWSQGGPGEGSPRRPFCFPSLRRLSRVFRSWNWNRQTGANLSPPTPSSG